MKKYWLLLLYLVTAPFLMGAEDVTASFAFKYDVDSTSVTYCRMLGQGGSPFGGSIAGLVNIETSSSSQTITGVNPGSTAAFASISAGDLITVRTDPNTVALIKVVTKTDDDTIVTDTAVNLDIDGGYAFRYWRQECGSTSTSGWLDISGYNDRNITIQYDQGDLGSLDARVECRGSYPGAQPVQIFPSCTTGACNTYQAYTTEGIASRTSVIIPDPFGVCRVGLKYSASDATTVTIGAATDDIDITEYINSYTVALGVNDKIDFVEDPAGANVACAATVAAAIGATGSATCTTIATAMNTAGICAGATDPTNTYACAYSTSTHKYTISRSAGALAFNMGWLTGPNNATSIAPTIGYTADDTAATSYVADAETGVANYVANVANAAYTTGASLCTAVQTAMNATAGSGVYTCSYSSTTGKITISAASITELILPWTTGTNVATTCAALLGYTADDSGALTFLADNELATDETLNQEQVTVGFEGYKGE